jgi:membrane protein
MLHRASSLVVETFFEWYEDRAPRLGAALAYYTVFALAPALILVIALVGLLLGGEAAESQIVRQIEDLVGRRAAEAIQAAIENTRTEGGLITTGLGIVTLLFGLWGVFGELQDALNTIWGVAPKPGRGVIDVVQQRFWSFAMVVGIGFLLLVSLAVSTWLAALGAFFGEVLPIPVHLMEGANVVFSWAVITLLFAMIFKFLPDVKLAWSNVWVGASVTALLFSIGKSLIGLYLGRSAAASTYGAAGSLIVILIWIYYSAQILFFGAEFTKVYSRRLLKPVVVEESAVPVTPEARGAQGMPRERSMEDAPLIVVSDGRPLRERLRRARINESDVLSAARRLQGLERMEQIKYAVLERSGEISIIPWSGEGPGGRRPEAPRTSSSTVSESIG